MVREDRLRTLLEAEAAKKILERDKVLLVVGKWVKADENIWNFEAETDQPKKYIHLLPSLSYQNLILQVRKELGLMLCNNTVTLTYQYPEWLAIEEGNGCPPQYISDDGDVTMFSMLRREIEEVNMFVTVGHPILRSSTIYIGGQSSQHAANWSNWESEDETSSDSEDYYHDFSSIPSPTENNVVRNLLSEFNMAANVTNQLTITPTVAAERNSRDKGKGVVVDVDESSSTEPPQRDYRMIPCSSKTIPPSAFAVAQTQPAGTNIGTLTGTPRGVSNNVIVSAEESGTRPSPLRLSVWGGAEEALSTFLNDRTDNPALFWRDAPPVFNDTAVGGIDGALFDISYEGDKLFVGRIFKSKDDCKIKCAIHAINRKFHFRTARSTPRFLVLRCISDRCMWRIYASRVDNSPSFQIRQANMNHSCTVDDRRQYHKLATTQVIGELMASRYVGIKKGPTPAGIRKILLDEYNVHVSYFKAWRGREIAMDNALGPVAGSYALLPKYLDLLETANPGTLTFIEYNNLPDGTRRFKYSFIAFAAALQGFQWVRKVIVVDGTSLKARYGGVLVSACCQDANFQIFPIAFGIVDSENDASWEWFFKKLNTFVPDTFETVFISDRHASIYAGLQKVYKNAHHGACTIHLHRNIETKFKSTRLADIMSRAARCFTTLEFNKIFGEIQSINPQCAQYLYEIGFEHWSRSYFRGMRYNVMDSNIAESWNNVIREAREFPIICMLEYIRLQIMSWFSMRREAAKKQTGSLPPHVRERVEKNFEESTKFDVKQIAPAEFEVQARNGASYVVNLDLGTCSCREFELIGLPCPHALACASRLGIPTNSMISEPYFVPAWVNTYVGKIYPIPAVGEEPLGGLQSASPTNTLPPLKRRRPGRPKKLRIRSHVEFKRGGKPKKRRCGRCFSMGHNKASCPKGT